MSDVIASAGAVEEVQPVELPADLLDVSCEDSGRS